MKRCRAVAGLLLLIALLCGLHAQPSQADKSFEVASIRPDDDTTPGSMHIDYMDGGRFVATNVSIKILIRNAFDLQSFQVEGGPSWLDAVKFDVNAKTGDSTRVTRETVKPLLRSLLVERFGLRYHIETRNFPVYSLAVAKGRPKLTTSVLEPDSVPTPSINGSNNSGNAQIVAKHVSMADLARELRGQLQTIVSNDTQLPGIFDFTLRWSFNPGVDSPYPAIFAALQDQLGLRLVPGKGPVEVVVIDHVERQPTEN